MPRRRPYRLDVRPKKRSINFSGNKSEEDKEMVCKHDIFQDLSHLALKEEMKIRTKDAKKNGKVRHRSLVGFLLPMSSPAFDLEIWCPAVVRIDLTFAPRRDL